MSNGRIEQVIRDKQGRQYQLRTTGDDRSFVFKLLAQGDVVGKVNCVSHPPGEMLIGDLLIEDNVTHMSENWRCRAWQKVFKPKPKNYRGRGLGTHLLLFVIDYACSQGIRRIYGNISQEDAANTPNLIDWYRKHGFQIGTPTPDDPSWVAFKIWMDLKIAYD